MKRVSHSLPGRSCAPGNPQAGFTLPEMLVALAVTALLALAAQSMLHAGFQQLRHLTQAGTAQTRALPVALQWLENDILQMYGTRPWRWEGTPDGRHCLVRWRFDTENAPRTHSPGLARLHVQYRVEGTTLLRDTLHNGQPETSQVLLEGVRCLQPAFWQRAAWHDAPLPGVMVQALKLTLDQEGPGVVRIWPVSLTDAR